MGAQLFRKVGTMSKFAVQIRCLEELRNLTANNVISEDAIPLASKGVEENPFRTQI